MTNYRILFTGLLAILTVASLGATAASAASYKSETATTYVTTVNEGSYQFAFGSRKVVCTKVTGSGEFTSGATSITIANYVYSGCTIVGQAATISMNGCDYKYGEPTGAASPYTVKTATIECPAGKEIVITATTAGCTIKIAGQTTSGTSTLTNTAGPPKKVLLKAATTNIKYTASGGICGASGTDGTTDGPQVISGFKDAAHTMATGIFGE